MQLEHLIFIFVTLLPFVHAGRGTLKGGRPIGNCNPEPTQQAFVFDPLPTCYHAADPSRRMGYCPDVSYRGWCNCGSDGIYPVLPGNSVCSYTQLPSSTLKLTKTSCASAVKRDELEAQSAQPTLVLSIPTPASATPTSAAPYLSIPQRRRAERLERRDGQISFSGCDGSPGGSWAKAGFKSMKDVLKQAHTDARALASAAQDVGMDNKGFSHYFGSLVPDVQLKHFKQMMSAIASNTNHYSVTFECSKTPDCEPPGTGGGSVMVTDATAGSTGNAKVIQVCSQFWSSPSSKYLLPLPGTKASPSPPYREKSTWCETSTSKGVTLSGRNVQWYATAGTSVLHELTHLDSLAAQAGLEPDDAKRHGTLDLQNDPTVSGPKCEFVGARNYLKIYKNNNGKDKTIPSPDYNAESYAAAATEIYFMRECKFDEMKPVVP